MELWDDKLTQKLDKVHFEHRLTLITRISCDTLLILTQSRMPMPPRIFSILFHGELGFFDLKFEPSFFPSTYIEVTVGSRLYNFDHDLAHTHQTVSQNSLTG